MKIGRPTDYTPELVEEICDAIACSTKGIRRLCKEGVDWPNPDTIYRWLKEHKDFRDQYARAKRLQVEAIVDEILEIADDGSQDAVVNNDSKVTINHEHINRSRLRIDTRKWLASKLAPKLYGNKVDATHDTQDATEEALQEINRVKQAYAKRCKREY